MRGKNTLCVIFLCVILALLIGCAEEDTYSVSVGSDIWQEFPPLTYGTVTCGKLEILPWNSGRTEATAQNQMAETENGFYYAYGAKLHYADKDDPGHWFPVCSKPECMHTDRTACDACIYIDRIVVRDNRIYYEAFSDRYRHLAPAETSDLAVFSRSPNGSDLKFACSIDEAALPNGGKASTYLSSGAWLYYIDALAADGSTVSRLYVLTDNGLTLLHQESIEYDCGRTTIGRVPKLYGEPYYQCSNIYGGMIFRIENGSVVTLDASLIPDNGGYISGNVLRVFRQNDGYYDINTETLEEIKVADAQLTDSASQICLPNCIVESMLLADAVEYRTEGMTHAMKIFNGEEWKTVTLPDTLLSANENMYVYVKAITSDSILFACGNTETSGDGLSNVFYAISLYDDEMVLRPL